MKLPGHLDAETIYELVEGRLEPARERAAEAHLWRCDRCRALSEECAAVLGALAWYGDRAPGPPPAYWDSFWARWPLAAAARAEPRAARPDGCRRGWVLPAAAAAAVALVAGGLWWAAGRQGLETARLASSATAAFGPAPTRAVLAGTPWEPDVAVLERVTFAVGSVDPLSKGVVLAGLAEAP